MSSTCSTLSILHALTHKMLIKTPRGVTKDEENEAQVGCYSAS